MLYYMLLYSIRLHYIISYHIIFYDHGRPWPRSLSLEVHVRTHEQITQTKPETTTTTTTNDNNNHNTNDTIHNVFSPDVGGRPAVPIAIFCRHRVYLHISTYLYISLSIYIYIYTSNTNANTSAAAWWSQSAPAKRVLRPTGYLGFLLASSFRTCLNVEVFWRYASLED